MGPPETQEGAVRAPQVFQVSSAVPKGNLSMPTGHELVVRKDQIGRLPPEGDIGAGQVEDIPADRGRGDLAQPCPGGADRGPEHHHPMLERRAQGVYRISTVPFDTASSTCKPGTISPPAKG